MKSVYEGIGNKFKRSLDCKFQMVSNASPQKASLQPFLLEGHETYVTGNFSDSCLDMAHGSKQKTNVENTTKDSILKGPIERAYIFSPT